MGFYEQIKSLPIDDNEISYILNDISNRNLSRKELDENVLFGKIKLKKKPYKFLVEFNRILECAIIGHSKSVRINRKGVAIMPPVKQELQYDFYINQFLKGSSIIINGIDKFSKKYSDESKHLDEIYKDLTTTSMFLTPKKSKGFSPHFDMGDVIVLQASGKKKWYFSELAINSPLRRLYGDLVYDKSIEKEYILEPGDWCYIPAGYIHHAETLDEISLHYTYSTHSPKTFHLLEKYFEPYIDKDDKYQSEITIEMLYSLFKDSQLYKNTEEMKNSLLNLEKELVKTCKSMRFTGLI
jgi:hypothetical protein